MKAKGLATVAGVCLLMALVSSGALSANLIVGGTFSGAWPAGINGRIISNPYFHTLPSWQGWGHPIGDNYVSAPESAVLYNSDNSGPGEGDLFVVVAVQPGKTYDLSLWLYTIGANFDGAGGADHWSKPFYAMDQTQAGLVWQPNVAFATVESQLGWTQFSTQVTIPSGWATAYLKLGVWSRFAAGSNLFNAPTYPRAQTDDWSCTEHFDGPMLPLHTAVWYSGANTPELYNVARWRQDIVSMKKLGLDGAWVINVYWDLNPDGKGLIWNEANIVKLKQMLAFAESQDMKVIIGLAYSWPWTPTWLINDYEFQYYVAYNDRVVRETRAYSNVMYAFCNELMWPPALYSDAASNPQLVQHFRVWCYNQNTNVSYWNGRWGTTYTWSTLIPGSLWQGNTNRQDDHMRWLNAMTQPRLAQLGDLVKSLAPAALLGWHDTFNQYYGDVSNPATSPLGTTNKFDFASTNGYGGLNTVTSNLSRMRQFFPTLPQFIGELGNRTSIVGWPQYPNGDEPFLCKPYLESQQVGYNWWCWQGYPAPGEEDFGFVDQNGNRKSAFSLLPHASQYGTIRGKLTDSLDPSKVMRDIKVSAGGVEVVSIEGGTGTVEYDDTYRIDLDPGAYTVTINHPLYQPVAIPGVAVAAGQDTTVNIALDPPPNMLTSPGFEGSLSGWVISPVSGGGNAWLSVDNVAHPGWSLTDPFEGNTYLVIGSQPSPGEVEVYQDVTLQPDTTYRLSWREKAVGSKFDGWWEPPSGADQWLTVSVDQKQGGVWGGPEVVLQQVQEPCEWTLSHSAFRTGPATDTVRIKFRVKMESGQDFFSGYPRIGIDGVLLTTYGEQLVEASSIGAARGLLDGTLVAITGTGTTNFYTYGYIEDPSRCSALQVVSSSPNTGSHLAQQRVVGYLGHDIATGERQLVDQLGVQLTHTGYISPIYLTNNTVASGGGDVAGLESTPGLCTTGLLAKVYGRVTERRTNYIVIDDGSGTPIRVTDYDTGGMTTPSWVGVGTYVQVIGNASVCNVGGTRVWCLRVPWWFHDNWTSWRVN